MPRLTGTLCLLLKNGEGSTRRGRRRVGSRTPEPNEPLATVYCTKEDPRRLGEQPGKRFATMFQDRRGVGDHVLAADGPGADGALLRPARVLQLDDQQRFDGRDERQDRDVEAARVRVPGP